MPRPAWTPPQGAVPAPLTMVIEVDGKGFPCARKDLKGRRGRDGGAARMRGANAIVIKWHRHVDCIAALRAAIRSHLKIAA